MEEVKKTKEHSIYKKRNGRFAVKTNRGKLVNGDAKKEILLKNSLIAKPQAKKPAPVEETPAESTEE
jgi:hypothetical protein